MDIERSEMCSRWKKHQKASTMLSRETPPNLRAIWKQCLITIQHSEHTATCCELWNDWLLNKTTRSHKTTVLSKTKIPFSVWLTCTQLSVWCTQEKRRTHQHIVKTTRLTNQCNKAQTSHDRNHGKKCPNYYQRMRHTKTGELSSVFIKKKKKAKL